MGFIHQEPITPCEGNGEKISHLIFQPKSKWHDWRRKARIPTMMILPKLVYTFNMIPVKISTFFFFFNCGRVIRVVLANWKFRGKKTASSGGNEKEGCQNLTGIKALGKKKKKRHQIRCKAKHPWDEYAHIVYSLYSWQLCFMKLHMCILNHSIMFYSLWSHEIL